MSELRMVGRVVKPHGVRGELLVDVSTDSADLRFAPGAVLFVTSRDGSVSRTLTVTAARPHSGKFLVTFDGVTGRDAADELRNAVLSGDIAELPDTGDPDEFYDHQLEALVPFVREIVPEVDLPGRRVLVDPPPGLFE